ncbi:MAG: hypothetical protein HFG45_02310 [Oscillospiraceae bacterium]|jgi:hypothetical protein|nr:hypothetical protein [Oscillospiraceae bacterium]
MREKLAKFMSGRYGPDALFRFQIGAALVLELVSLFLRRSSGVYHLLNDIALILMIWAVWRALSRNVQKRYLENLRFLELFGRARRQSRMNKEKFSQRKDYKFFVCPNCKTNLRVPKGKGDIYITCAKCGNRFRGKT